MSEQHSAEADGSALPMSPTETSSTPQQSPNRKLRFRLIVGGIVVFLVAALILTPPYVNVNRYRRRITTTMSESLGRPVHLDNVTLHLLPVPGLTLSNLVVSEDPAFGYEPIIRANTVEATLRASSLWRRQVEFSTVRFIDPSVNLVRNALGKWNLEDVLMQASHVDTAPTAQRAAGPAPRFPYIEATGARLNVKLGNEKKPFSLTETQFALWLPSPQLWQIRMRGKPTRTDSNVSQAGEMALEGSLQRAQKMADVPIDIHASWSDAPLGEASHLLTGNDAGWRGTMFEETRITGLLSRAAIAVHVQLNDLRRTDFVPAQPLDVTVDCTSTADVARATLTNAACAVPVGEAKPLHLSAVSVDLEKPKASPATIEAVNLPTAWIFSWAKLFISEIPESVAPSGDVNGELAWNTTTRSWQGTLTAKPPQNAGEPPKVAAVTPQFEFAIDTQPVVTPKGQVPVVRLAPAALRLSPNATVTLSGSADANGYGLQLTGAATNDDVLQLAAVLPPLNQGVKQALPNTADHAPHAISLSCSRLWGGPQACVPLTPVAAPKLNRPRRRR